MTSALQKTSGTVKSRLGRWQQGQRTLRHIAQGRVSVPSVSTMHRGVSTFLQESGALHGALLPTHPSLARKVLWSGMGTAGQILTTQESYVATECLGGDLGPLVRASLMLRNNHLQRNFDDLQQGLFGQLLGKLVAVGALAVDDDYDAEPPHSDEVWQVSTSLYLRDVLEPAIEAAMPHVLEMYSETSRRVANRVLRDFFTDYQVMHALRPHAPADIVIMGALQARYALEPASLHPSVLYSGMSQLLEVLERGLAALPANEWAAHGASITRDFPAAAYYRAGLDSEASDAQARVAMAAASHRPERLVMHLAAGSDLSMVKQSLRLVGEQGEVIVVDKESHHLQSYTEDPELRNALNRQRLRIWTMSYLDTGHEWLKRHYAGRVTRAYLLHPVGQMAPLMHDLMAPGGLVMHQISDPYYSRQFVHYDRPMFLEGDFDRLAGYANGPALFDTDTAEAMSYLGMRVSIAQRRP